MWCAWEVFFCSLQLIGLTCSLTAQYFAAKAATGTATALRNNLFSHIGTSVLYRDRYHRNLHPDHTDDQRHQPGAERHQHDLAPAAYVPHSWYSAAMVMAFTVDAHTAMVFAVTIPVLCVVVFGIMLDKYAVIPVCAEAAG